MTRTATITRTRSWNVYRVHTMCIKYGLYTFGSNSEFEAMLEYVRTHEPDDEAMLHVAKDILYCSESNTCTMADMLGLLEREAVVTAFHVEE